MLFVRAYLNATGDIMKNMIDKIMLPSRKSARPSYLINQYSPSKDCRIPESNQTRRVRSA